MIPHATNFFRRALRMFFANPKLFSKSEKRRTPERASRTISRDHHSPMVSSERATGHRLASSQLPESTRTISAREHFQAALSVARNPKDQITVNQAEEHQRNAVTDVEPDPGFPDRHLSGDTRRNLLHRRLQLPFGGAELVGEERIGQMHPPEEQDDRSRCPIRLREIMVRLQSASAGVPSVRDYRARQHSARLLGYEAPGWPLVTFDGTAQLAGPCSCSNGCYLISQSAHSCPSESTTHNPLYD